MLSRISAFGSRFVFFGSFKFAVAIACASTVVAPAAVAQSTYDPYYFGVLAGAAPGVGSRDGTGSAARFNAPTGVAADSAGNIYVADQLNSTVRKITPAGVVSTLAGLAGSDGSSNGTGSGARFFSPNGVAVDSAGNVYVADSNNNTIRKITPNGVVSTLAGLAGSSGSADGTGSAARFNAPTGVAVDRAGNVYVADFLNYTIRKITSAGVVSTVAGRAGASGSTDGTATAARFSLPRGVAVDSMGSVYVADWSNSTIRKVSPTGVVSTLAGRAGYNGSADGTGSAARFTRPLSLTVDSAGNVYVADGNSTIRKITPGAVVSTLAGLPNSPGSADGSGNAARFDGPASTTTDSAGNIYVADQNNNTIRKITPAGVVSTLAGLAGGFGSVDATGSSARFNAPYGVALDAARNVYVADTLNNTIRKITPAGAASTVAGLAGTSGSLNGAGSAARFYSPYGVAVDAGGNIYVGDTANHTIRKIDANGLVSTLAGLAGNSGTANGTGSTARFNFPAGVAVDRTGNVYVADMYNQTIRKITPSGVVSTFAGQAGVGGSANGVGAAARFLYPQGVAVDSGGNLYVADRGNSTIRKITPAGAVSTLAGRAGYGGSADGVGTGAQFGHPQGLAVDSAGTVYVADTSFSTIRKITPAGVVSTLAGLAGKVGPADGLGSDARFNLPKAVAVDGAGRVYVADTENHMIRVGNKPANSSTTTLISDSNPAPAGSPVTFTAGVTSGATGTVMFKDGATTLGSGTLAFGKASFTTSALGGGTHMITAVYTGNAQFNSSTSDVLTQMADAQVTIGTNPAGLAFTVDGTSYTSSATFSWTPGSSHTIGVATSQSGNTGVRYVWSNWSQGGAATQVVAPSTNKSFIASFATQYYLTVNSGSGGKVTPSSGWRNSGAVVALSATPDTGYVLKSWAGSGPGSFSGNSNGSVTMSGPITESATFTPSTPVVSDGLTNSLQKVVDNRSYSN